MSDEHKAWLQQQIGAKEIFAWLLGLSALFGFILAAASPRNQAVQKSASLSAPTVSCDQYNVCTPSNASEHVRLCNKIMSNGRAFVAANKYDLAVQSGILAGQMHCDFSSGQ